MAFLNKARQVIYRSPRFLLGNCHQSDTIYFSLPNLDANIICGHNKSDVWQPTAVYHNTEKTWHHQWSHNSGWCQQCLFRAWRSYIQHHRKCVWNMREHGLFPVLACSQHWLFVSCCSEMFDTESREFGVLSVQVYMSRRKLERWKWKMSPDNDPEPSNGF